MENEESVFLENDTYRYESDQLDDNTYTYCQYYYYSQIIRVNQSYSICIGSLNETDWSNVTWIHVPTESIMQMCASFQVIRATIQLQYYDVDVTRLKIRGDGK